MSTRTRTSVVAALVLAGVSFADQILETLDASLTTYLAAATKVQNVRPRAMQRGVNHDGSLRAGSTFPMAIAGNPFENVWRGEATLSDVRLDTGTYHPTEVDLSLPAPGFRWVIGRTYNARQDSSGQHDSSGPQGINWFQTSQPEIVLYQAAQDEDDIVYLVYGADRFAEFERFDATSTEFKGKNGAAGVFQYASGSPDLYVYTDQVGNEFTFFGFNTASNKADGQIWKIKDPAGNVAYVGDATTASTAVTNGFDSGGRITKAYDSADRRYTYTYNGDTPPHLTSVVAETKSSGTWASPSGLVERGKVEYEYFGSESYGDAGDLKLVKITMPLTDSGVSSVKRKYFRYWEGAYNSGSNPGHVHALKLVLDYEGARNFDWGEAGNEDPEVIDEGYKTASHATIEPYAVAYFEYDSSHRINETWSNGACGCSGGATGTHLLEYETSGYTNDATYDNEWARRTVVRRPDTSYMTQYFDEVGQSLHRVVTDIDPDSTSPAPQKWVTAVTRNSDGQVSETDWPDSIASYTHSTGAFTVSSSAGLIRTYTRVSSGDTKGFLTDTKYKTGSSGSAYFEGTLAYDSATKTIGDVIVTRPLIDERRVYSQAITSGTTGSYLTTFVHTAYGSPDTLSIEKVVTTYPAVTNNGSGSSDTSSVHYKKDGTVDFEKAEDAIITYRAYTNGQLTTLIEDADTTSLSPPTGFSSAGTELHHDTVHTYDAQGRLDLTTMPDGRVSKRYYTKLADAKEVVLSYAKYEDLSTDIFHGPVDYVVRNHAGKAAVQGVIALSGNTSTAAITAHIDESDDDPITAVDTGSSFGSVAKLTTELYNKPGEQVAEVQRYFAVPGSGAGDATSNYDPTLYGYDDSGRRWRVKEAHGTIYRTAFDLHGRATERQMGTNDASFSGGEPSGTDNMVKTEDMVYDSGADDGNGRLTSHSLFVVDGSSGERETTFTHDLRGNVLLETRPAAPHTFNKFDNMNRLIASGQFSSTGSITVASDDPTTETANRLALSQTFYDERGRVWKSQSHKIDASDGSDDDNLQSLTWFDSTGRVIKVDGEELAKTFYDRLGRATHHFTLSVDDDTLYSHVDDLSGDTALLERQATYAVDSSNVIMEATISRLHDDLATGTTGALDTNADSDAMQYTAANLEGRIQISAMWFDGIDRLEDRVEYGTNGGSNFDRDPGSPLSPPTRSDTALRSTYTYYDDGELEKIENPRALVTRYEYDDAGQRTKAVQNYSASVNSGNPSGTDDNVTVKYEYKDGLQTKIIADMPSGTSDQETLYIYGTTDGTPAASEVSTGHLLRATVYPDSTNAGTTEANINSDSSDVASFAYNAQGEEVYKKDQAGNVIETVYDVLGRETDRKITTLAGSFDGAVRRITTAYTSLGQMSTVTQYDAASSGSVVDEVKHTWDDWGGLTNFEQDRNSTVGGGGDQYTVSYTYEKATAGRNTIRRSGITLPGSATYELNYRATGNFLDRDASRVTRIKEGSTTLVNYDYNGVGEVVGTIYDEPDVMWKMYTSSGVYPDLDQFNRVTSSRWTKDLASDVDFYDLDLTYDRNSNITWAEDNVHAGFDVKYTMDDVDRLTQAEEGTRSGGSITSKTRDQIWTLSHTGNWTENKVNLNGDADLTDADELDEDRTHNEVNEIGDRDTNGSSPAELTLVYDAVGNLTDDDEDYEYEYDAYGRLRKVKKTTDQSLVSEFKYNGLGFRISSHQDTEPDGDVDANDKWYHFAYDERWRMVATYRESDASPKERFVYHQAGDSGYGGSSYIDLISFRDKDANTAWTSASDGVLENRVYYCQNWRADTSGIVSSGGGMKEWVKYSSYGTPIAEPFGDTNSDGDRDGGDQTQVNTWRTSDPAVYNVKGDVDLDGDVDATDEAAVAFSSATLGRDLLSDIGNRHGFAAYLNHGNSTSKYFIRYRIVDSNLGFMSARDFLGEFYRIRADEKALPSDFWDSANAYQYVRSSPVRYSDWTGLYTGTFCYGCGFLRSIEQSTSSGSAGDTCRIWLSTAGYQQTTPGTCKDEPICEKGEGCKATWSIIVNSTGCTSGPNGTFRRTVSGTCGGDNTETLKFYAFASSLSPVLAIAKANALALAKVKDPDVAVATVTILTRCKICAGPGGDPPPPQPESP